MRNLSILFIGVLLLGACSVSKQTTQVIHFWTDVAVIDDKEVHIDTTRIEHKNGFSYAWVKTIYTTIDSKSKYVNDIKQSYIQAGKLSAQNIDKRMEKWNNFSYNITRRVYDCSNKRYKIVEVTDYSSKGEKIISIPTAKNKERWFDIGVDSMSDYAIYFICDYGN